MPTARSTRTEVAAPSGARIEVERVGDRTRVRTASGLLRAQQVHGLVDRPRVALIAASALLLGGDQLDLDVRVGSGACLDLIEVAGTVAYPGPPARWSFRLTLGAGSALTYAGQPFVVAGGAEVDRSLTVDLEPGARLLLRETLVLGRTGEIGGGGRNRTRVEVAGRAVLVEEQPLDPALRLLPGVLAAARVFDNVLVLGPQTAVDPPPGAATLRLAHDLGWSTRWLGTELAESPLDGVWAAAIQRR
ncbi:MAG: urease accessory protein UreD [Propionibacteriaceae bacterium]